jgi:hypothetical protein
MKFKLILLAFVISVAYYIIKFKFYSRNTTDIINDVISNSEQTIRHNYEKYGILGLIGMIGVIIVVMSTFFDWFYWVNRISKECQTPIGKFFKHFKTIL